MFYWSFTSLAHFWPPTIFNPGYAYAHKRCLNQRTTAAPSSTLECSYDYPTCHHIGQP